MSTEFSRQGIMITMITTTTCKGMRPTCKSEWSYVTNKKTDQSSKYSAYIPLYEKIQKIINQQFNQQALRTKDFCKEYQCATMPIFISY